MNDELGDKIELVVNAWSRLFVLRSQESHARL